MFELEKAIGIVSMRLEEAYQHNETGQHYKAIDALEGVLNDLRNAQHAEMIIMEAFAREFEQEANA